jgi:hypothetical protein
VGTQPTAGPPPLTPPTSQPKDTQWLLHPSLPVDVRLLGVGVGAAAVAGFYFMDSGSKQPEEGAASTASMQATAVYSDEFAHPLGGGPAADDSSAGQGVVAAGAASGAEAAVPAATAGEGEAGGSEAAQEGEEDEGPPVFVDGTQIMKVAIRWASPGMHGCLPVPPLRTCPLRRDPGLRNCAHLALCFLSVCRSWRRPWHRALIIPWSNTAPQQPCSQHSSRQTKQLQRLRQRLRSCSGSSSKPQLEAMLRKVPRRSKIDSGRRGGRMRGRPLLPKGLVLRWAPCRQIWMGNQLLAKLARRSRLDESHLTMPCQCSHWSDFLDLQHMAPPSSIHLLPSCTHLQTCTSCCRAT